MTAPRPAVAAPRRAGPAAEWPSRPQLRIVAHQAPRGRVRLVLALSTVLVFAVLLLAAAVHTTIASGQRELDRVDTRITEATRQNQGLRLQVAELQSPARIVEAATRDGMVVPEDVTWLSPGEAPAPPTPADEPGTEGAPTDERAGDGAADGGVGGSQG